MCKGKHSGVKADSKAGAGTGSEAAGVRKGQEVQEVQEVEEVEEEWSREEEAYPEAMSHLRHHLGLFGAQLTQVTHPKQQPRNEGGQLQHQENDLQNAQRQKPHAGGHLNSKERDQVHG